MQHSQTHPSRANSKPMSLALRGTLIGALVGFVFLGILFPSCNQKDPIFGADRDQPIYAFLWFVLSSVGALGGGFLGIIFGVIAAQRREDAQRFGHADSHNLTINTRPNEVRNALLVMGAIILVGWALFAVTSPEKGTQRISVRDQGSTNEPRQTGLKTRDSLDAKGISATSNDLGRDNSCSSDFLLRPQEEFTVTDTRTGHQWHRLSPERQSGIMWQDALEQCEALGGSLPAPHELLEILKANTEQRPMLDRCAFPEVPVEAEIWSNQSGQRVGEKRALRVQDGRLFDASATLFKLALCLKRAQ